jgi:hypothetical protein
MKILWIEDFGGGLSPSKVVLDIFGDLIPKEIFDRDYDPVNEDVSTQLNLLFANNSLHQIHVCKSYSEWRETFEREASDFDVALIDINLEAYRTPINRLPEGIDNSDFDKKAGFHIYHQLIKNGFSDENIAFFTGEENSLRDFSRYCGEILIEKPRFTFEKKATDFQRLRKWLSTKASTEELILRRGIIEGCRYIRDTVSKIDTGKLESSLLFFKTTTLTVDTDPEMFKAEVIDYLTKLESFFLWYREHQKSYLLFSFVRELAEKWDISSGYFSKDKEQPLFQSKLEDNFHRTSQAQMKRLRNWSVHGLLTYELSERDVAFFFIIAMRAWIKFDLEQPLHYEKLLLPLFSASVRFSESEIERNLEQSYFDLRGFFADVMRSFRDIPDPIITDNYFLSLVKALGEVPERIQGRGSDVVKRKIRQISMTLFYQSYWHGLFPLWLKGNSYGNLQTVGFNIDGLPDKSFLAALGQATFRDAFEHSTLELSNTNAKAQFV